LFPGIGQYHFNVPRLPYPNAECLGQFHHQFCAHPSRFARLQYHRNIGRRCPSPPFIFLQILNIFILQIFRHNLENKEFYERLSSEDRDLVLRVMVGALILFDHIDANGAFCRQSPIEIRGVVEVIKQNGSEQQVGNWP
jgi:hypothetical protein